MIKLNFGYSYLFLFLAVMSCSAEKFSLSPLAESFEGKDFKNDYSNDKRKKLIVYSSEITNLISSFPKFRNDAVNAEVSNLKSHLKDYIIAMEDYNVNGLNNAHRKFEKSYKKLQNLRKYLNEDDDQILNRYLVRIKTNMTFMESNISKESNTAPKN